MTRHIDYSMLQDYQEGLLDQETEGEVRVHVEACPRCREELDGLVELRAALGSLPLEAEPERDLWPQIAWRMEGVESPQGLPAEEVQLVPSTADQGVQSRLKGVRRGRVTLPAWQLLAASIALMVISGSVVWTVLSGRMDPAGGSLGAGPTPAQFVSWDESYGGYDEAVSDLEAVLEQGRAVLDPETVRVLEENLQAIDRAIQEAGDALSQDPASTVLQRFLADNYRKKVDLLRQAAGAVYATT